MSSTTLRRLIVIVLILLWEVLPRTGAIPELFLPSLSSTLQAGWSDAGEYGHALVVTLYEVAVAMVFACGGGILAGAVIGSLPRPRVLIMPMVSSLYAVPLVILYPVFTVWLGIGSESKIAFASVYGFCRPCWRPPPAFRPSIRNCCSRRGAWGRRSASASRASLFPPRFPPCCRACGSAVRW
jgi:ABC-type nitrate/sulfonate/bicarbonate transport system permease component